MSLPRYLEYKDCEVRWLGNIPAHWSAARLKEVIRSIESGVSVNATDVPAAEGAIGVLKTSCVYDGTFRFTENKAVVEEDLARVSCPVTEGTLIVSRMNTPALVGAAGLVSQSHPNIYLPDRLWQVGLRNSSPRFVHYWTLSAEYRAQVEVACSGTSSSMQNLGQDQFKNFQLALPLEDEQHAIATFLDRETAKIDALIAEQEKLLALLAEKRQATISHAVTRGLNPNAPMKDSGIPWLGELPAHWEVIPLKHLCSLLKDGTHLPPPRVDEGVPLLSVRNIDESVFAFREDDSMISTDDYLELCRGFVPRSGDVLLAIVGATLGKAAVVPNRMGEFHIQRSLAIFRPKLQLLGEWLFQCISSGTFQRLLWENVGFSAQPGIYLGTLSNFKIPVPPLEEQRNIVRFLITENRKLDALKADTERAISLLKDRRSAMISAAVTGKIDVRHAA